MTVVLELTVEVDVGEFPVVTGDYIHIVRDEDSSELAIRGTVIAKSVTDTEKSKHTDD